MEYELISNEEYSNLPEDNELCFVEFESICRRNMNRLVSINDPGNIEYIVRENYMSSVYAVAQECNISDVTWYSGSDNGFDADFRSFSLSVQGAVARIRVRLRGRQNAHSVLLTSRTRTKVEHYVSRIRDLVDNSEMDPERKKRMGEKLDQLLHELSKNRVSFAHTMTILVGITTTIAGVVTIAADGKNAVTHILELIGLDKQTEEDATRRLSPPAKALPAPKANSAPVRRISTGPVSKFAFDDDDIPF